MDAAKKEAIEQKIAFYKTQWRVFEDRFKVYYKERWALYAVLIVHYLYRVLSMQKYVMVTYFVGIHTLGRFMAFLQPADSYLEKLEEDLNDMEFETDYVLPMSNNDEYKGFQRKVGEFELW